ncbi:MAG: SCO family protein [Gaiellaceae bacterium]
MLLLRSSNEPGDYRGSVPPEGITLPDFTLPDNTGESVSTRDFQGKVVLVTFLDAQCTDACPIIASQIAGRSTALRPTSKLGTPPSQSAPTPTRIRRRR